MKKKNTSKTLVLKNTIPTGIPKLPKLMKLKPIL